MLRSDLPIELPYNGAIDYDDAAGVDMDQAAGDIGCFIIPFRCQVIMAGAVVTETCAGGTTTPVVDFDLRPTAGSDTSRGAADIGHLVLSTTAAGKVMYDKVAVGTVLEPGQEIVFELKTAATGTSKAGHVRPFVLVQYLPEVLGNLTNMVETA
jgi:hypothetical protein